MNAYGIHTFAGLFTQGVKQIFDVVGVTNDGYGNKAHAWNHPEVPIWTTEQTVGAIDRLPKIDFIYAQPECAPWSTAGKMLGLSDPRLKNTTSVFDIGLAVQPDFLALESVVGAYTKGKDFYEELSLPFKKQGYLMTHLLVNNMFLGTPQDRKRYFLLLHKKPLWLPDMTEPKTLGEVLKSTAPGGKELMTNNARKALEEYGWADVTPGTYLNKWFSRNNHDPAFNANGTIKGRPPIGDKRLKADAVAPTFTGHYTYLHPTEERALTMDEAKAWCGVEKDYDFCVEHVGEQAKLLARSVMPNTGKWIASMAEGTITGKGQFEYLPEILDLRTGVLDVNLPIFS